MVAVSSVCFSALRGQDKAKMLVRRTIAAGRMAHAYIFQGPEGVGKSLFAKGVAAAVNCHDKSRIEACGDCVSCRKFRSGNHPDLTVVRPEKGAVKIDQVRRMSRELTYPPYESETRVVILEDVHTMRREAANSLLKTLEEPPVDNILILTSESSHGILATLTSRCQILPFFPLSIDDTVAILVDRDVDADKARILAHLSEGSPGRALLLEKKDLLSLWKEVVEVVSDPDIDPSRDVDIILQLGEKMGALKENLQLFLGMLQIWLRDLLLGDGDFFPSAGGRRVKKWDSGQILSRLRAVESAGRELDRNCNKNLVCEVLLFRLQSIAAGECNCTP